MKEVAALPRKDEARHFYLEREILPATASAWWSISKVSGLERHYLENKFLESAEPIRLYLVRHIVSKGWGKGLAVAVWVGTRYTSCAGS